MKIFKKKFPTQSTNFQVREIGENIENYFIRELLDCLRKIINDLKLMKLKYDDILLYSLMVQRYFTKRTTTPRNANLIN